MIAGVVTGNVGNDPELRYLADGTAVLSISVASNERVKKDGEYVNQATWVRCTLFGKRAESLAKVVNKGSSVAARGSLAMREYEKDGVKRQTLEMRADDVEFTGKRDHGDHGGDGGHTQPAQQRPPQQGQQRPRQPAQGQTSQGQGQREQRRPSSGQKAQPPEDDYATDGPGGGGGGGNVDDLPFASCAPDDDPMMRAMRPVRV